jgi:hypothetical protein
MPAIASFEDLKEAEKDLLESKNLKNVLVGEVQYRKINELENYR